MLLTFAFLLLFPQEPSVFAPEFRRIDPTLTIFRTIYEGRVSSEFTLSVVLADAQRDYEIPPESPYWNKDGFLGVFLRDQSGRISTITAVRSPMGGGNIEVDHADANSVVLFRTTDDYGTLLPALKVFIDPATRRMVRTIEYWPSGVDEVLGLDGRVLAQFTSHDPMDRQTITIEKQSGNFQIARGLYAPPVKQTLPSPWSVTESTGFPGESMAITDGARTYELPVTDLQTLARLRPTAVRDEFGPREVAEINDHMGPYQLVGNDLWFGKTFYDGEGLTGVGGFGYFDLVARRFVILTPPAIVNWSVSAILVESDAIWLGLVNRPEGADNPGGLLRYDRNATTTRVERVNAVINRIVRHNGTLYLGTAHGLYVMGPNGFTRYLIEPDLAGSPALVEIPPQ